MMKWKQFGAFANTIFIFTVLFPGSSQSDGLQDLPSEHDNFEDLRINDKVYVDKSSYIKKLLDIEHKIVRFCRPPNFGKSTFVQMLNSFFSGRKELFKGLKVYSDHDWHSYPVIYLDFNVMNVSTTQSLEEDLRSALMRIGKSYNLYINELYNAKGQLDQLIDALTKRDDVIILLNDYDRPAREQGESGDFEEMNEMKDYLQHFLSIFRYEDRRFKLLFMTCTVPLELNLNGMNTQADITNDSKFNGMIGLEEEELVENFKPYLHAMTNSTENKTFNSVIELLKQRYDGYCLSRNTSQACRLYGFSSVIACLRDRAPNNFWPSSEAMERFTGRGYYHNKLVTGYRRLVLNFFKNITISMDSLDRMPDFEKSNTSCEIECPDVESAIIIMVLYGYLTLRDYDETKNEVSVDFPNQEVREKFIQELLNSAPAAKMTAAVISEKCDRIRESLFGEDSQEFFDLISGLIFDPRENVTRDGEYVYTDRFVRVLQVCDIKSSFESSRFNKEVRKDIDLIIAGPSTGTWNGRLSVKFQSIIEFDWYKTADRGMDKVLKFLKSSRFNDFYWDSPIQAMAVNFNNQGEGINDWIRVSYHGNENFTHLRTSSPQYIDKYTRLYLNHDVPLE